MRLSVGGRFKIMRSVCRWQRSSKECRCVDLVIFAGYYMYRCPNSNSSKMQYSWVFWKIQDICYNMEMIEKMTPLCLSWQK